jgi:hypothetical protein
MASYPLDEFLHLKPNDLLQWKGIECGCTGDCAATPAGAHPYLTRIGGPVIPVVLYLARLQFASPT